jgi:hypothetical protein
MYLTFVKISDTIHVQRKQGGQGMSIMPLSEFSGEKNESCDNRIMRWRERYYRQEAAISTLKAQRDELLAALKEISLADTIAHSTGKYSLVVESCAESARAAIANAVKYKP